ncbi:DUF1642 domain-containing protein [Streptococcus macedonicus]|uniref:Phage protein n=1 Tax=Streptococcus gallolyticus TaxID=315405 RepID=A0A380K680_9STRE|nr:DUF1642 domain-containing protein [Streptococcus macedonicus]WGK79916.1 DUF1642 domain-containing protein [Streptococcus macedonicus]SUN60115.1 phage protein [Streptococcus gallolyticus]
MKTNMNKQEAIEQINYMDTLNINDMITGQQVVMVNKNQVLDIINQIDEPQKPKVPQVAVEFYERYKDDSLVLGEWFGDFYSNEAIEDFPRMDELTKWLYDNDNETNRQREFALVTLVTLGIDAVEVEKEKLYTAKVKIAAEFSYLNKHVEQGYYFMSNQSESFHIKTHFPQSELEDLGLWDNPAFEIEEVEE